MSRRSRLSHVATADQNVHAVHAADGVSASPRSRLLTIHSSKDSCIRTRSSESFRRVLSGLARAERNVARRLEGDERAEDLVLLGNDAGGALAAAVKGAVGVGDQRHI